MSTEVLARGRIIRLDFERRLDGQVRERAVRTPGVRALVSDGSSILVCREWREELAAWDIRLPGGKVFDELGDFEAIGSRKSAILQAARAAVARETAEETGLELSTENFRLLGISLCGATVSWDLYYFCAKITPMALQGHASAICTEEGESTRPMLLSIQEACQAALDRRISEDRSAMWLLRYAHGCCDPD